MISFDKIIEDLKQEFEQNPNVNALLITGSVARGEAKKGNDLDILIVTDGKIISKEYREGESLIEIETVILPQALKNLEKNPMQIYKYFDAIAIFDKNNSLEILRKKAQEVLSGYKPTEKERIALKKWLSSVLDKVNVAQRNKDQLKISFHVSNVLWKILEGLYLINSLPTPASTSALQRISSLKVLPSSFEELWKKTLLGNLKERTTSSLKLIQFVLSRIDTV